MKYIRTKETEYGCIIDMERFKAEIGEECCIPEDEIVKQADTIEELINRYIVISGAMKVVYNKVRFEKISHRQLINDIRSKKKIVYGAIWTIGDHGEPILKSVSQMNEEGELELL